MRKVLSKDRLLRGLVLILALLVSVCPVRGDFERSEVWFKALSDDERIALQTNLTLAGFYDAFIDGVFGPSTYRAIAAYQLWNQEAETGVLTPSSARTLELVADTVVGELDLQVVDDARGGLQLAVPRALLPETTATSVGTAYTRPDGLMRLDTIREPSEGSTFDDLYRLLTTENDSRKVSYTAYRDSYFVVSGTVDATFFYSLMLRQEDASLGFTLNWSGSFAKEGAIVSLFLASFVTPTAADIPNATVPERVAVPEATQPPAQALPPSAEETVAIYGNFLVFKDLPGVIGLRGSIGPSTPLDFRRALRAVKDPKVLMLASDGGYVSSALLLAYEVRELGLATYILPETGCYSACSFVFLAGAERRADGALGVHQVWSDGGDASAAQTVISDILEAFADFGVRQEITSAMLRTRPEEMYVFSKAELDEWGIDQGNPMALVGRSSWDDAASSVPVLPDSTESNSGEKIVVPVRQQILVTALLADYGVSPFASGQIERVLLQNRFSTLLRAGSEVEILLGSVGQGLTDAWRVRIYNPEEASAPTIGVALSDNGDYVRIMDVGELAPSPGAAPEKGPRAANNPPVADQGEGE